VAFLAVYRGDQFVQRVELGESPIRIGRAPENDLVLEDKDKGVSRIHAEIRFERGRPVIVDLNSQNGVWVGDRRVRVDPLQFSVPLTIGPYRLVLEMPEQETQTQAIPRAEDAVTSSEAGTDLTRLAQPDGMAASPQQARPGEPNKSQKRLYFTLAGIGAVAVTVLLTAVVNRAPVSKPQPPSAPTLQPQPQSPPQPEPAREQQFRDHYEKARALLANGDKAAAFVENEAARKILPDDPRGLEQQQAIASLPDVPTPRSETAGTQVPAEGAPSQSGPPTLIVAVMPEESPRDRVRRNKDAKDYLDDGKARLKEGEYDKAIALFENAVKKSGRSDYGYKPNEAQELLEQARQGKEQAEKDLKAKRAQDLILKARARSSKELAAALKDLQEARSIDPSAPGVNDLIRDLQERARSEGEQAYKDARQYDSKRRYQEALTYFERAVQLLELVPGGGDHLEYAKKRREELRTPK
jgi:pSer/pThr/pTyr-binding forkhead associated (FHA) protein